MTAGEFERAAIRVYESDGSDGYSAGTWGVVVTLGASSSSDGGWPSRELAQQRGREMARSAETHWRDEP